MALLYLASCMQRKPIPSHTGLFVLRSNPLRLFSSNQSDGPKNGNLRVFKNPKFWMIRQWFLDNTSNSHPTETQLEDLMASSGLSSKRITNMLFQLRSGFADPHSRRWARGTYEVRKWFMENHTSPYPGPTELNHLVTTSGLSIQEIREKLRELRYRVVPRKSALSKPQKRACLRGADDPALQIGKGLPQKVRDRSQIYKKTRTLKYQCTACSKTFDNVFRWRRHEFEVHRYNPTEWTCMPYGLENLGSTCEFCSERIKDLRHFEQHNTSKCLKKDRKARTFRSKGALVGHIQRVHLRQATESTRLMFGQPPAAWEQVVEHVNPNALWCGFCQSEFESVDARMDHVHQHYKDGKDMKDWVPRPSSR
ncbi:hypothetical protein EJ07DRAFT_150929 [Lizonia empirigonia]|nr:hypothetical protein EJ07DRAFT_150929 [Lizonia empirigonia]